MPNCEVLELIDTSFSLLVEKLLKFFEVIIFSQCLEQIMDTISTHELRCSRRFENSLYQFGIAAIFSQKKKL